jgi:hypothetical protein
MAAVGEATEHGSAECLMRTIQAEEVPLNEDADFHGFRPYDFDNLGTICVDIKLSDKLLTLAEQRKSDSVKLRNGYKQN